jgi:hypothetical protein
MPYRYVMAAPVAASLQTELCSACLRPRRGGRCYGSQSKRVMRANTTNLACGAQARRSRRGDRLLGLFQSRCATDHHHPRIHVRDDRQARRHVRAMTVAVDDKDTMQGFSSAAGYRFRLASLAPPRFEIRHRFLPGSGIPATFFCSGSMPFMWRLR